MLQCSFTDVMVLLLSSLCLCIPKAGTESIVSLSTSPILFCHFLRKCSESSRYCVPRNIQGEPAQKHNDNKTLCTLHSVYAHVFCKYAYTNLTDTYIQYVLSFNILNMCIYTPYGHILGYFFEGKKYSHTTTSVCICWKRLFCDLVIMLSYL